MSVEIEVVAGRGIDPWLDSVAQLRIAVFRDFPYLYDGDTAYERDYLATYAGSADSVFVLAIDGGQVVGASTGVPMREAEAEFRRPFLECGLDPGAVFYFGESVLLPAWRGRGIGGRFFDERERHARALGADITAFCAVQRADDHPRRPAGYRPLDAFWHSRGYRRRDDMRTEYAWLELGESAPSPKAMAFWLKHWT